MRRTLLVILLILGLCPGFWQEDREMFLRRTSNEVQCLQESVSFGETLTSPEPVLRFSQIFAVNRQQPQQIQSHRQELPQKPAAIHFPRTRGQHDRSDDAILPDEWGLVVSRLPRSDG